MKKTFMKTLMGSTIIAGSILAAGGVASAQAADEDEAEEIVVTGSRIVRKDNYSAVGPVNVINSVDIDIAAKANLGDLLEELPSVSFTGDGSNANNGSGGLATVNLRGLGTERVLVLMNGKRVSPVGSGINNLVDLQIFPTSVIERVEVLKDGAGAVYGADAMSGVINIISQKDFEGIDLTARAGVAEKGDGETFNLGLTMGAASERGSVMMAVGYREQEGIYQADRDISDCPRLEPAYGGFFADDYNSVCSGSSFTPAGRFYVPSLPGTQTIDENGNPTGFSFFGGDTYNFNPLNYIRTPSTALNAFVSGNYQVTDGIDASVEVLYSKRRSKQDLAPVPLGNGAQVTYGLTIPGTNPFNVFGEDIRYRKRMLDVGPRLFDQESDTIRLVGSLSGVTPGEGTIPFFGGANWETYYTADLNQVADKNNNLIDMFRVQSALDTEVTASSGAGTVTVGGQNYRCADALARNLGCVPLNLFGLNSITPEAAQFIRLNTVDKFQSTGSVLSGTLSNTLFELPAGDVSAVIGVEYRDLSASTDIDAAIENGYSSGNPNQSTKGELSAVDYFGEIEVPLLAGVQGAEELTLSAAYRVSDYDTFDAGDTYRLALSYRPIEDLRLRATRSTSFRAPSINDLFNGGAGGFPTYSDPCASPSATTQAAATAAGICAAQGVTPGVFTSGNAQILVNSVGSRIVGNDLNPELGEQTTFGIVYTPSNNFLSDYGFEVALDYFDIEIEDGIVGEGLQSTLNDCYLNANLQACSKITRPFGDDINQVNIATVNSDNKTTSEGIDFSMRGDKEFYKGDLGLNVSGTYYMAREDIDADGNAFDFVGRCTGFIFACFNEWRVNTTATYSTDNVRASWTVRALSDVTEDESRARDFLRDFGTFGTDEGLISQAAKDYTIQDWFFYSDVNMQYSFDNDLQVAFGVDNVFNKKPPYIKEVDGLFSPTENTAFGTYDTIGRSLYFQIDKQF